MGNIDDIIVGEHLSDDESSILKLVCRIFATITNIPVFISIILFLINLSDLKLNEIIQLKMCISIFIYESSHYFTNLTTEWKKILQCISGYGFQIMMAYYTTIYSYVALVLFIKPLLINTCFYKFVIFFSSYFLLAIIIVFILFALKKTTYYDFSVQTTDIYGRLFNYGLVLLFSALSIINTIRLLLNIKKSLRDSFDFHFAEEKLQSCKKELKKYIIGTLIIFHYPILILLLFGAKILTKKVFENFYFCLYVFINKSLMGLIYWLVFVFSRNLWHRFLIMIKIEKPCQHDNELKNEETKLEYNELKNIPNLEYVKGASMEELEKSIPSVGSLPSNYGEDEEL